jgi:hypothetical protein
MRVMKPAGILLPLVILWAAVAVAQTIPNLVTSIDGPRAPA